MTITSVNVKARKARLSASEEWDLRYGYQNIVQFWINRFILIMAGKNPFWDTSSMANTILWNSILLTPMLYDLIKKFPEYSLYIRESSNPIAVRSVMAVLLILNWAKYLLKWNIAYNGFRWLTYRVSDPDDYIVKKRYKALFFGELLLHFLL